MPKDLKDTKRYKIPLPPIENLVFEGGGAKGAVYPGAIQALAQAGILPEVKRVAGSSAGGIIALFVALGFTPDEISADCRDFDFTELLDRNDHQFWSLIGVDYLFKALDLLASDGHGVYEGDRFLKWAQMKVFEALGNPQATFADLQAEMARNPRLKALHLTGTNLSDKTLQEFSFEKTPNVKIAEALRATMSFPGAFKAFPIQIEGKWSYFIDGGVISNYPMYVFDRSEFQNPEYGLTEAGSNPCSLGFKVDSDQEIKQLLWHMEDFSDPTTLKRQHHPVPLGLQSYLKNLIASLGTQSHEIWERYSLNTVQISDLGHRTLDFEVSARQKSLLEEQGYQSTQDYLELYRGEGVFYGLEPLDTSKRPEMNLKTPLDNLLRLRTKLTVAKKLAIKSGIPESSIAIISLNERLIDIENHPSLQDSKVPPVSREVIALLVEQLQHNLDDKEQQSVEVDSLRVLRRSILSNYGESELSPLLSKTIGEQGNEELLQVLLKTAPKKVIGICCEATDENGYNLITLAASSGHWPILKQLAKIAGNRVLNQHDAHNKSPLYRAAENGKTEMVLELYKKGVHVNHSGPYDDSAIICAARNGHFETVSALLSARRSRSTKQFNLTATDPKGRTFFHYLAEKGELNASAVFFRQLRNHKTGDYVSYTSLKDDEGNTPLHLIAIRGQKALIELAEELCCYTGCMSSWALKDVFKLNETNRAGYTPLELAMNQGHIDVVDLLLTAGARCPIDMDAEAVMMKTRKMNTERKSEHYLDEQLPVIMFHSQMKPKVTHSRKKSYQVRL